MRADINRLLSKYIRVENLYYKQNIEEDLLQEADLLYDSILKQYRFSRDFLREKDLERILIERDLMPRDHSLEITRLYNAIKLEQMRLFHNFNNPVVREQHRKQIGNLKKKIYLIQSPLLSLRSTTIEGYAEFCRFNFLISQSLYNKNKRRIRVPFEVLFNISSKLDDLCADARAIAKSSEWRVLWTTEKTRVFRFRPLASVQRSVVQFSQMYDSVYKSPDRPSEQIIADDDALDGWFHHQANKGSHQPVSAKVSKHRNVMTIVNNQDDANKIYMSNDTEALKSLGVVKNVQR